ncbi:MAG: permease, partial [Ignavibacteria bacterium]
MNISVELIRIVDFVFKASINILPFFLASIIIAALINQFNFTQKLSNYFKRNVFYAISIATIIGAVSPLCSCGVIPTIFALLNVGIPLAPIMSFWITSPIMSPEAFMITWGYLGLEIAVVRLIATILIGLAAGYLTLKL